MTPSAMMVMCAKAPPEKTSMSWKRFWLPPVAWWNILTARSPLIPGTGICAPILQIMRSMSVKTIFVFNSGIEKMRLIPSNISYFVFPRTLKEIFAFSSFSRAPLEKACASIVTFFFRSPWAKILRPPFGSRGA